MKSSTIKSFSIGLLTFVYLTSAVGYTAVVHFCRLHHHPQSAAADCCCTHAAAGVACDHHGAQEPLTFENTDLSADLRLSAPVCCENRIGYRQVEAPTLRTVAAEEMPEPLCIFSPTSEQFSSKSRLFTPLPIAFQINLPLLI